MENKFILAFIILFILSIVVFLGIAEQSKNCTIKGGTPIETNEGLQCLQTI